ncbi:MAG: hypothetical protein WC139_13260 [Candidatus Kapaibacterium sp.]
MTILLFFSLIIFAFLFILIIISDDADIKIPLSVGAIVCFGIFAFLLVFCVEKDTSIKHIENKPVYEKHYIIDASGSKVDSVYVKIKTK